MKFGYILAGMMFLANPNIGIFDLIPDFIGYLLIIKGLATTTVFVPPFRNAEQKLWKLFVLSIVKILLSFILLKDIHTLPLVLSFTFGIIELLLIIPLFNDIFGGITYSALRYGSNSILHAKKKRKITYNPENGQRDLMEVEVDPSAIVKNVSVAFIIFRTLMAIVPTLIDLQLFDPEGEVLSETDVVLVFSNFENIITLFVFTVCLIGSIIWICFLVPYMRNIIKDRSLRSGLNEMYCKIIEQNPKIPVGTDFKRITIIAGGAVLSYVSLVFDGVNYLPNAISAIFALFAFISLSKYLKKSVFFTVPSAVAAVISVLNILYQTRYFSISGYTTEDALWISNARRLYSPIKVLSVVENILMLIIIEALIISLYVCWKKENAQRDLNTKLDSFLIENRRMVKSKFTVSAILLIPVSIIWAVYPILVLNFKYAPTVAILLTILWAFISVYFVSDIYNGVYKEYLDIIE